jgi:hypothetical protein
MKNILFSTTRQWNPGDEFILRGIRYLFSKSGYNYNTIIYNRHPSITPRREILKGRLRGHEFLPHYDNSFILNYKDVIDYVIFAGTPEWYGGKRMDNLHQYIIDTELRCSFIGVGVPKDPHVTDNLRKILTDRTDLFIARDPNCYKHFSWVENSYQLSCPALFSAPFNRLRGEIQRLGIVIQNTKTINHKIPNFLADLLAKQYQILENKYEVHYIPHYIDDLIYARNKGLKNIHYSAFSEDYAEIFDKCDFVISPRVHGCGMASSLGIPNILIPHDGRFSTALGFKSQIFNYETDILEKMIPASATTQSQELLTLKNDMESRYLELFKASLPI